MQYFTDQESKEISAFITRRSIDCTDKKRQTCFSYNKRICQVLEEVNELSYVQWCIDKIRTEYSIGNQAIKQF